MIDCMGFKQYFRWYLVDHNTIGIEDQITRSNNILYEQLHGRATSRLSKPLHSISKLYHGTYPFVLEENVQLIQPDGKTRYYRKLTIGEDVYYEHIGFRHAAYLRFIAGNTFQNHLPPYRWIYENMEE